MMKGGEDEGVNGGERWGGVGFGTEIAGFLISGVEARNWCNLQNHCKFSFHTHWNEVRSRLGERKWRDARINQHK